MTPVRPSNAPRLEPGSIERTHLLAQLALARHKTCMLLLGPAGSGKTSLALQWRGQALAFGHDVAWLSAHPGDDGQSQFDALFAALDHVDPHIAREARLLFNRSAGTPSSADAIAIALLRGITDHGRVLVLVLDDWQNVIEPGLHRVMQTLLDFAPPTLRLVIVSRSVPPLALARLRDHNGITEIGPRDLRFTLAEVQAFLQARQRNSDAASEARRLLELTDGWAAGLQLVTMEPRAPATPVRNAHHFNDYFEREVLHGIDQATLDAMVRLSAAHGFNHALAALLAGPRAGGGLLDRLRSENLFVVSQDGPERAGWFRFHPLFRDLLHKRFERLPPEERQRTHALLSQWFGQRRHLREAVHHAVAAGDVQQATDWVERWARDLFLAGDLQQLVRAVAELPRAVLQARPSLLSWVGWTQLCYHQFADCHATLAALSARIRDDDATGHAHCLLLAFSLALQEDDFATAQQLLPAMEAMRTEGDAVLAGGRRNLLAWLHASTDDCERARALLQGSAPQRENGTPLLDSPFGHFMAQSMLGLTWLKEGDVREAERVLREALAQAEQSLGPFSEPTCNIAAYLAAALYESGDLDALRKMLDGRTDTIERVVLPDALLTISVVQARLRRFEGNPHEAIEGLARLEELAQRRSLDRTLAFALYERVRCLLQDGDLAQARQLLHLLQALAARHGGSDSPVSRRVVGLSHLAAAVVHAAGYDDRAALQALSGCGDVDAPLLSQRDQAGAEGLRAVLLARTGERERAIDVLRGLLLRAQRLGLVRSLLDVGDGLLDLAEDCARKHGSALPLLAFHVEHLRRQASISRAFDAAPPATLREPLSDRELEVLRALTHSMSNKRIAQVLGVSPETVKWHLRNVYGKLGVAGRDDAVARARDFGLVG